LAIRCAEEGVSLNRIIAGPNGAGKTTFAEEFLPNEADCPIFVNADLIAAGFSPFDPERAAIKAGRLVLEEIELAIARVKQRVKAGGHNHWLGRNECRYQHEH
jgi:predicted ABC-type ATPase